MTRDQAAELAGYIIDTWAITPKARIWIEALTPMDYDHARQAYIKLRRNRQERDMTVGLFTDEYRRIKPAAHRPEHDCPQCGDGWLTVEYQHNGRPYRGAVPCTACEGRDNEHVWNSVRKGTE